LRSSQVARALVSDTLSPELPLLANVGRLALARGVPAHLALHRAALELDALGLAEAQSLPPTAVGLAAQRLAVIARALVCRPRLLILERPDLGLGPDELTHLRVALLAAAANHGCCILMTCNQPRLAAAAHLQVQIPEA
jgi:predicted ABC-type transport system involved in lysophospholipase L1 biosynthesis ATPase subunit